MSRSLKKGPYVDEKLLRKVMKQKQTGDREPVRTWARACTVTPDFVGHTFLVHNGRSFDKVFVIEDMVGHKLGEFALTRTFRGHGGRRQRGPQVVRSTRPAARPQAGAPAAEPD